MEDDTSLEEFTNKSHHAHKERTTTMTIDSKTRKYERHIREMNFMLVKEKETKLKTGDEDEIYKMITEGQLKFTYTNPSYSDGDCRAVWNRGYVNVTKINIKNLSAEVYANIEYNGQLLKEGTSMSK